jgi:hypothetical protein
VVLSKPNYLNNASVVIANRLIVADNNALEMLDDTTLKITGTRRFDSRINQT